MKGRRRGRTVVGGRRRGIMDEKRDGRYEKEVFLSTEPE